MPQWLFRLVCRLTRQPCTVSRETHELREVVTAARLARGLADRAIDRQYRRIPLHDELFRPTSEEVDREP